MKGIVLKPWEVEAFLQKRKSRVTRVIKLKYGNTHHEMFTNKHGTRLIEIQNEVEGETFGRNPDGKYWVKLRGYIEPKAPYKVGDILFVKEKWCNVNKPEIDPEYAYFADTLGSEDYDPSEWEWRSSIHMPFEAARIFLRVNTVNVERLHNIGGPGQHDAFLKEGITYKFGQSPFNAFLNQWNRDHPNCIYAMNPWVWVYEVEQISKEEAYGQN